MAKRKKTNNDLQNSTQKAENKNFTKNQGGLMYFGKTGSSCGVTVTKRTSSDNFTPVSVNTYKNMNETSEKVMGVKTNQT